LKERFLEKENTYFAWTLTISVGAHLTFFLIIFGLTVFQINYKKLTPISSIRIVSVRPVSQSPSQIKTVAPPRPVIKKPIVKQPALKPPEKNKIIEKKKIDTKKVEKPKAPEKEKKVVYKKDETKPQPKSTPLPIPPSPPQPEPQAVSSGAQNPPPSSFQNIPSNYPGATSSLNPEIPGSPAGAFSIGGANLPEYYAANARLKIMSHFNVPSHLKNTEAKCKVSFDVARNGTISGIKIEESSGNPILDTSAIRAIEETESLAPLPDEFKGSSLHVFVTFDFSYDFN